MQNQLYALRHCKTSFNAQNIISGQTDCPLIDYTVDDSILEKSSGPNSYILITSSLSRCVETGEILRKQSNFCFSTYIDNRLIERNMGVLEGLSRYEASRKYPSYFCNEKFNDYMTPPMGESYVDFKLRVNSLISLIEQLLQNYNVILCSHNQTLRMLTALINDKQYTEISKYPNGTIIKIF